MPLFSSPEDPRGLCALLFGLVESGGLLFALMGWATAALGLAEREGPFWLAGLGLVGATLARRAFFASAVVELFALSACVALAEKEQRPWIFTGALLVGLGRVAGLLYRRFEQGTP